MLLSTLRSFHLTFFLSFAASSLLSSVKANSGAHKFTLVNKCPSRIRPRIVNVDCIDTTCTAAEKAAASSHAYTGKQLDYLGAGGTRSVMVNEGFIGRIFAQNGHCGSLGEDCSMAEFNLDSGSFYTPQAYDISNIQGFTTGLKIIANNGKCSTVSCPKEGCPCDQAYPVGDETGCGNDLPVRGCGAGPIEFEVVFCPPA